MEAPLANELSHLEKTYKIESDQNNVFNLTIRNLKLSIEFCISFSNDISIYKYQKKYSIDELKKNNKYFRMLETIDQIFNDLIGLINKNTTKISESSDNLIYLIIPLESQTIKEIIFQFNRKEKNEKEKIEELYSMMLDIKKENISLKEKYISLENKYISLQNKCISLENENIIIKKKINNLQSYNPNIDENKKKTKEINLNEGIKNLKNISLKKSIECPNEENILSVLKKLKSKFPRIKEEILMNALEAAEGNYNQAVNFINMNLDEI